ncbi:hypothetical protein FB446DRAFT_699554 [Lentinula raphanica]|nr:hypothetical protein FB446DRAFT_699554 [Lentinula raphanica]
MARIRYVYRKERFTPSKAVWAGALSLTWVCSWWRRVALSYPTIWRSIHINTGGLPLDDIISLSSFAEFAGELLRRSGPCLPLDIGLEVHHSWPRLHDVDLAAVLVLLNHIASYTGRWRRFHITSNVPRALKLLTDTISTKVAAGPTSNSIISNPFPLLEEFSLNRNRAQENLGFRFTLSYKRSFSNSDFGFFHVFRIRIGEQFPTGVWNNLDVTEFDEEGNTVPSRYFESYNALEELKEMCIRSRCGLRKIWLSLEGTCDKLPDNMFQLLYIIYDVIKEFTHVELEECLETVFR